LYLADLKYCSDNAAMIGRVAVEMYEKKQFREAAELTASPKSTL
jgi:N6-L-threonylcarbamoyladenine synthase